MSRDALPVERDSVPLHLVSREPVDSERALLREVVAQPGFWQLYGAWLGYLHPAIWEEARRMAQLSGVEATPNFPTGDIQIFIDFFGLKRVIDRIGLKRVVDEVGLKRVVDEVGLKRVVDEVGLKRVVDEVGLKRVVDELGPSAFVAQLSPEQREEFRRLLE
jgi:hypothetical protein